MTLSREAETRSKERIQRSQRQDDAAHLILELLLNRALTADQLFYFTDFQ